MKIFQKKRIGWADGHRALGKSLEVSRQTVRSWIEKFGVRSQTNPNGTPAPDGGWYNVEEWRKFKERNELGRQELRAQTSANNAPEGARLPQNAERQTLNDKRCALADLQIKREQQEFSKSQQELLVASELEVALGMTLGTLNSALRRFPSSTARFLVGIKDIHEITERLENEMDALTFGVFQTGDDFFAERVLEQIVEDLPAPEEFSEATFRESVHKGMTEAAADFGRRCLARIRKTSLPPEIVDSEEEPEFETPRREWEHGGKKNPRERLAPAPTPPEIEAQILPKKRSNAKRSRPA